jgi:sucrose-6-phosphate hydrolase SacC (GH32 family)
MLPKAASLASLFAVGLLALVAALAVPDEGTETLRPLLHFTPPKNFMNDPNGLVHLDGEYHPKHNFEATGGPHEGAAVSRP